MPDEGPEIKTCVRLSSLCTTIFAIFFFNVSVGTNSNISKKRLAALSIFVADWHKYANVCSFLKKRNTQSNTVGLTPKNPEDSWQKLRHLIQYFHWCGRYNKEDQALCQSAHWLMFYI